jgi:XTP/dITP diphosphohydrolase
VSSRALDLLLATGNDGKVQELRALLADLPLHLRTRSAFPDAPEVVEDRGTLEGNARKKAETLAAFADLPALADDTGLEVDALGGRPGVRTARFAGPEATGTDNRRALLAALDDEYERAAQFRTVVALAAPGDGATRCVEGVCRGHVTREERGEAGFGYDAVFVPEGQPEGRAQTFAEMRPEAKNALSHRRRALDKMRAHLERKVGR